MKRLKVMTVVGTRPEVIRLSRVISRLDEECDHVLVHTGQNYDYELNDIFFDDLELRSPDHYLNAAAANAAHTIGNVIISTSDLLESVKPDAVLVLGDTNSGLALLAAKRKKIPSFHMEAGNRCFDQRVPEEINRKLIDHISDINMPYSSISREYLISEGFSPDQIIKTGSPMREVLAYYSKKVESSDILNSFRVEKGKYFVLSMHREENVDCDTTIKKLFDAIRSITQSYGLPIIFSLHPRTKKRIEDMNLPMPKELVVSKPLNFTDYINLQSNAHTVLSDSGTISEESNILDFCAVNLREAHERPEAMEEAAVIMTGMNEDRILQAISVLNEQRTQERRTIQEVKDYDVPLVSEKVVRIIHSYTDYVNHRVWFK